MTIPTMKPRASISYHRIDTMTAHAQSAVNTHWVNLWIGSNPRLDIEDLCLFFLDARTANRFAEAVNAAFDKASCDRDADSDTAILETMP